ncbi:Nuclear transport factor 2 [Apophysomyces sp. BC1015]|nr:Nuclear transport factor 2 [Apophysomyces sp. BC1015]
MAEISTIAQQFTYFYNSTFDKNRKCLASLYRDQSMLTFEGQKVSGVRNIVEKLVSLPFAKCTHKVETIDTQPSKTYRSIIICVNGLFLIDGEQHAKVFYQSFLLIPCGDSFYVFNDIFQ